MPGRRNRCPDCCGSGRCTECFGSAVNVHLNEPEQQMCRGCQGTGRCGSCEGTGMWRGERLLIEIPLGLRCLFSAFPAFPLYKVLIEVEQVSVHSGGAFGQHVGPVLPKPVGWLSTIGICGGFLFALWKDVKREDFSFGKSSSLPLLTCGHSVDDECLCPCHSGVQVCHPLPCCTRCQYCGRRAKHIPVQPNSLESRK
jgi:hypothetical protein